MLHAEFLRLHSFGFRLYDCARRVHLVLWGIHGPLGRDFAGYWMKRPSDRVLPLSSLYSRCISKVKGKIIKHLL